MTRTLHAATSAALDQPTLYPALLIRLDIEGDPLYMWTGPYDYTPSGTGDAMLDGITFTMGGHIAEFSSVIDSSDGSQPVSITLPGIDPNDVALKQIIWDARIWQFKPAYIWLALLDDNSAIIGTPIRLKTARIDTIEYQGLATEAKLICTIEGHQAWAGEALNSRWSEQKLIDPTDTSNNYVATLANKQPTLGSTGSTFPTNATSSGGGGYYNGRYNQGFDVNAA